MMMKMPTIATLAVAVIGLIFVNLTGQCEGALEVGFYKGKCGLLGLVDVESTVSSIVKAKFLRDPTITPALIRMQFHDCFVNGCDASILLDGKSSEKTAPPNLSVRGYNVIDDVKAALEILCPGVVSCADIIAMATRDVVSFSGGKKYQVETGRRDGLVSLAKSVNLPPPNITVSQSISAFAKKGLNVIDMVYLLGGHTVGVAHCSFFQDRLYNYKNTGKPDPSMDSSLLIKLRRTCPPGAKNTVNLDQNSQSSLTIDKSYHEQILLRKGILQIDQDIALSSITKSIVAAIASANDFSTKFGDAMVKLGRVEVLTGTQGQIRKSCRAIN